MKLDGDNLLRNIKTQIPKFKIVKKGNSKFMKFINFFLKIFNPHFMTAYITTIGYTVYWPDPPNNFDDPDDFDTLWHEATHALQAKRWTRFFFGFLYLFPQSLSLFSLLSLLSIWLSPWFLLCLLFLICLAPFPAPWRVRWELEAFQAQIFIGIKERVSWNVTPELTLWIKTWVKNKVERTFCGWDYYKMSWNKKRINEKLIYKIHRWEKIKCPFIKELKR